MNEYTVSQYAQLKGVTVTTVYRWLKKEAVKHKTIGKITIILTDEKLK
jgi:predicted site-specific integrase-resolvase